MAESYFGGRRNGSRDLGVVGKVPVFRILERRGKVNVEFVNDVKGDTLVELAITKIRKGSLIFYVITMFYFFEDSKIYYFLVS